MGKKYKHLFESIVCLENLKFAYKQTLKGKRKSWAYLEFKEFAALNLEELHADLVSGNYQPSPLRDFWVYEPKPRLISAPSFRDRIVHHALCAMIGPILDKTLLPRTFACRNGKGTHAGVRQVQADLRKMGSGYCLKTDFSRYFASIQRDTLTMLIAKKIACPKTMALIKQITPSTGVGIPIGALTSQFYANLYGGVIDRVLQQTCKIKTWARYMDDIVVLDPDLSRLFEVKRQVELVAQSLGLSFSKWSILPVVRGVNFLGYRIWATHKLLRRQSVISAKRKLKRLRQYGHPSEVQQFVAGWSAHAAHADTCNLRFFLEV